MEKTRTKKERKKESKTQNLFWKSFGLEMEIKANDYKQMHGQCESNKKKMPQKLNTQNKSIFPFHSAHKKNVFLT